MEKNNNKVYNYYKFYYIFVIKLYNVCSFLASQVLDKYGTIECR